MTDQQIKAATGTDLGRMAGAVLQPKPGDHDTDKGSDYKCVKCGVLVYSMDDFYTPPACIPDPITLTWDNAMKWRDWMYESFSVLDCRDALMEVMSEFNRSYDTFWLWWTLESKPEYYIKAAMLCKNRSNK